MGIPLYDPPESKDWWENILSEREKDKAELARKIAAAVHDHVRTSKVDPREFFCFHAVSQIVEDVLKDCRFSLPDGGWIG